MPFPFSTDATADDDRRHPDMGQDGDVHAMLKPIMAGARARGVADGLEMLGVGAVLIDATGRVLHVGGRGRRLMGGHLQVIEDHLVAERPVDNRAIEELVGGVITGAASTAQVVLTSTDGRGRLMLRAIRFETDEGPSQRLHAVLVIEETSPL